MGRKTDTRCRMREAPSEAPKGMNPFRGLISFEDAKEMLLRNIRPISRVETVPLEEAHGRVSASDIVSPIDVPPFERAAMDGFAVIASDTFHARHHAPRTLTLIEVIDVGSPPEKRISRGECAQIVTGAPMPAGADAVVMAENTEVSGTSVHVHAPVYPGENVGKKGEDIKKGEVVVGSGSYLTPGRIGACAAIGVTSLRVYEKPRIGVIPSGEEIVLPGKDLNPGEIYDVNSYTLSALIEMHGCSPVRYPAVRDHPREIMSAIQDALKRCDMVILSGGSSVGPKDLILDVLSRLGRVEFHGVAVKPGKPTLLAVVSDRVILGMPGYPTSCLTNGYGFLVDALRKLSRLPGYTPLRRTLPMGHRITSTTGRVQFLPVKIENGMVYSVFKESGAITSMSKADGYILIPASVDLIEKGDPVEVILFES